MCLVAAGDRLLKVNSVSVEGLSHEETVEILQSSLDDVTLLVSQPKERLFTGITSLKKFKPKFIVIHLGRKFEPRAVEHAIVDGLYSILVKFRHNASCLI